MGRAVHLERADDGAHSDRHRCGGDRPQLPGRTQRRSGPAPCGEAVGHGGERRAGKTRSSFRNEIAKARNKIWDETAQRGRLDDFPLKPERILEDVRRVVPPSSVLVTDVGWNKNGVAQRYRLPDEGVFLRLGA